jgi:hypothetical protein
MHPPEAELADQSAHKDELKNQKLVIPLVLVADWPEENIAQLSSWGSAAHNSLHTMR